MIEHTTIRIRLEDRDRLRELAEYGNMTIVDVVHYILSNVYLPNEVKDETTEGDKLGEENEVNVEYVNKDNSITLEH